jgi:hypothetical protein
LHEPKKDRVGAAQPVWKNQLPWVQAGLPSMELQQGAIPSVLVAVSAFFLAQQGLSQSAAQAIFFSEQHLPSQPSQLAIFSAEQALPQSAGQTILAPSAALVCLAQVSQANAPVAANNVPINAMSRIFFMNYIYLSYDLG